jgi:predicted metal-dependent hydrolase
MQDAIRRNLEKAFGKGITPEFWFVIETDSDERFHLHGAVETPNLPGAVQMVDQALRAAGGRWDSAKGHQHQQVSKGLDDPIWWAFYAVKEFNVGKRRIIDAKLFASTAEIRARARSHWECLRGTLPQNPP